MDRPLTPLHRNAVQALGTKPVRHRVEHAIGRGVDDLAAAADRRPRRRAQQDAAVIGPGIRLEHSGDADDLGPQRVVDLFGGDIGQFDRRIVHGGMDYHIGRGVLGGQLRHRGLSPTSHRAT